jgi:hypothetical protein
MAQAGLVHSKRAARHKHLTDNTLQWEVSFTVEETLTSVHYVL